MVSLYQNDINHISTASNRNPPPVSPIFISAVYFYMANNHGIVAQINITKKKILNTSSLAQLTFTGEGRVERGGECLNEFWHTKYQMQVFIRMGNCAGWSRRKFVTKWVLCPPQTPILATIFQAVSPFPLANFDQLCKRNCHFTVEVLHVYVEIGWMRSTIAFPVVLLEWLLQSGFEI